MGEEEDRYSVVSGGGFVLGLILTEGWESFASPKRNEKRIPLIMCSSGNGVRNVD